MPTRLNTRLTRTTVGNSSGATYKNGLIFSAKAVVGTRSGDMVVYSEQGDVWLQAKETDGYVHSYSDLVGHKRVIVRGDVKAAGIDTPVINGGTRVRMTVELVDGIPMIMGYFYTEDSVPGDPDDTWYKG